MNLISLFLTFIVGLFIIGGSLCGIKYVKNKKFVDFSISLAFGVIISLICLEILPETYKILINEIGIIRGIIAIIILVLIGIVVLKILDVFVPCHTHEEHHEHNHKSNKCHNDHLHHIGIVSAFALILHNIIEGMSLYLVSINDLFAGIMLCVGIGLHNIPMGLIISSTLINSKYSTKSAIKVSVLVSLSTFVGGVIMFILGGVNELFEGVLLGLTLGMLVYIAIFELLHQIYHMKEKKVPIIGIIVGVLILVISIILGG